ncbi:MAG: isochorismatase family protein [Candidatus Thermoplasmatota archaeon]|nr:isochorismatase family protein [Candidatus Thermoplasmatota archaeon]
MLRRLGVDAVAITGTQTPNCIRATAYDADMNDFDTVIIQDCISSKTREVQEANIKDFINVGFTVLDSGKFIADLDSYTKENPKYQAIVRHLRKQRTGKIKP